MGLVLAIRGQPTRKPEAPKSYDYLSFLKNESKIDLSDLAIIIDSLLTKEKVSMPEAKKETKAKIAKPKSPSKPKVAKAKPAAKPKVKATPKFAPKVAVKPSAVKAPSPDKTAKKPRSYTRKPKGSFADLLKKQAELEQIRKSAKADFKKQYDGLIKEANSIKVQYRGLFNDNIESAQKTRGPRTRKVGGKIVGLKPFSLGEVKDFVEQKKKGKTIKIQGRRPKSIARMEDAYRDSEDAEDILRMLNQ